MPKKILMTPADFFGIEYEINAWMHEENQVDHAIAAQQWQNVYDIYTQKLGWEVALAEPIEHLPDMVFATDCCLMIDGKILLSNFRFPERQPETAQFKKWFEANGYGGHMRQAARRFEGGGDNLVCGDKILAGYGFRSDPQAADELRDYFGLEVVPLHIIDPFFYHLDTSVAVLSPDTVAFYPAAIDAESQARLRAAVPNVIEATLEEAQGFGLNAVSDGHTIITSDASPSLLQKYQDAGFQVIGTPILEFRKSGGGVKCMTLELRA
jgi:N-dimethylarginine dimethylaminohydrolase